ncbi:hypothetical protein [Alkalicoccus daliensis]|uniref:Phage shock protein A (PspA) family protein n=1 Tax=Alkalicoccus daliensis TaxID=745820 RepID=A0A1H0CKW8_9BACI|nr:hypothetical protein [Alkalicoccus daliensis]SDN58528.1 phage shock protein A (PspA) family protein [Alkalicoccus daliensis]
MSNVWERFTKTIREDMEKLSGTSVKEAVKAQSNEQEKKAGKIDRQLREQKQLIRQFEKEKDEVDVMIASRKRQLHLAKEEGEEKLAEFAEKDLAAYEKQGERLERMIHAAKEQQMELEHMFQEMTHQLKERKLEQLEIQGKEKAASLRQEMRAMNAGKEAPAAPEAESPGDMHDLERQLLLLEKRHAPKENPADYMK